MIAIDSVRNGNDLNNMELADFLEFIKKTYTYEIVTIQVEDTSGSDIVGDSDVVSGSDAVSTTAILNRSLVA